MIKKVKFNKNSQNIIYEGNSFKNIINLLKFILIGEKIKSKYNCKNCYIEEFRDIYKKINFLKSDDALELKKYFKK